MSNVTPSRVMAGVTAGYLLGRTRKLKLALIVGSAIANRKLVSGQVDKLTDAAGVGPVGQQLVSMGRKAAISAVSSRIDSLSDRLAERTNQLNGVPTDAADLDADLEDEYDEPVDEGEELEDEPVEDVEDEYVEDEEELEDEYDEPVEDEEELDEEEYEEAAR